MNIPMCKAIIFNLCEFVINDVIENVREDFIKESLDESILENFKCLWKEILHETKAVEKVEIKIRPQINSSKCYYKIDQPSPKKKNKQAKKSQKSAIRPQVSQVPQQFTAVTQQGVRPNNSNNNANQNEQFKVSLSTTYYKVTGHPIKKNTEARTRNPIILPQIDKVFYDHDPQEFVPVTHQVVRPNNSNNIAVQNQPAAESSKLDYKLTQSYPTNKNMQARESLQTNNPQVRPCKNISPMNHVSVTSNSGFPMSQQPQILNQMNVQLRPTHNATPNGNIPRLQNSTVNLPTPTIPEGRYPSGIVQQPSNAELVPTTRTQIPNSKSKIKKPNSYDIRTHQNYLQQYQQFLIRHYSKIKEIKQNQMLINTDTNSNVSSHVDPSQMHLHATTSPYMNAQNVIPIFTTTNQGNLNEISQPADLATESIVQQPSNSEMASISHTQIPNVRPMFNHHQHLNQQFLTGNSYGFEEMMQYEVSINNNVGSNVPSHVDVNPSQMQRRATTVPYMNAQNMIPISTIANQSNLNEIPQPLDLATETIVEQLSNFDLELTANTQIPNLRPMFMDPIHHQHLNQQFLTRNPYGFEKMMQYQVPINNNAGSNVPSHVDPNQMQRRATFGSYMNSQNVTPISTIANQGNLNKILQLDDQNNLKWFDKIKQLDGVNGEIDDVDFMSDSGTDDSDDNTSDNAQGNDGAEDKIDEGEFTSDSGTDDGDDSISDKTQINDDVEDKIDEVEFMSDSGADKIDFINDSETDDSDDNISDNDQENFDAEDLEIGELLDDDEELLGSLNDDGKDDGEPPLNSDDDLSIESTTELFDSDNVVICLYDKIVRGKQNSIPKWKIYMKDGFMHLNGKEYVFKSAFAEVMLLTHAW